MSKHRLWYCVIFAGYAIFGGSGCDSKSSQSRTESPAPVPLEAPSWQSSERLTYEVIREWPHDPQAFTQGLLLSNGQWLEGTGGYGSTYLRRVDKATGKILQQKSLADVYFGEGVTELMGRVYQLSWKNQLGFVYDAQTLEWQKNFTYQGEGWGLTTDGHALIMSNGTDRLRFLDRQNFAVQREVSVSDRGRPVALLNELEWVEGEIFANVWMTDEIVRIDPRDGRVLGRIDLRGIRRDGGVVYPDHVLNGIAYDAESRELFVTGKCWPRIYQIRLVPIK